jgi:hypothetical protein
MAQVLNPQAARQVAFCERFTAKLQATYARVSAGGLGMGWMAAAAFAEFLLRAPA